MPPKKHVKFDQSENLANGGSVIPGPLNLARLQALNDSTEQLSDGDLRFHSSEDDDRPAKRPATNSKVVTYYDSEDDDDVVGKKWDKHSLKKRKYQLLKDRQDLPLYQSRHKVLEHVLKNQVTVLLGETGSGKSTQLPQLLLDHNKDEKIAVTQPRRVAAINLATRVAEESGSFLGSRVGYSVRFQNKSNSNTKVKYLTDGMLMRELIKDPNLKNYSTVILDEAHERTVLTDLLMGLMKQLLKRRSDLRLVVMSATLDADKFSSFFNNAPVIFVEGKMYPVQRYYLREPIDDAVEGVVQAVCQTNSGEPDGDILVFLAGQEEIDKCVDRLNSSSSVLVPKGAPRMAALPLYASLAPAAQQRAFQPVEPGTRKVILATNIAETSLTIPGVRYVIDSGLRKVKVWKPDLGLDTLLTTAISQASAAQRMGRAGREAPGKCFRLYTEQTYHQLSKQTEPEILRCDIASTALQLKKVGVDDVLGFEWVESPKRSAIEKALLTLYTLKALDNEGKITKLGHQMVGLPLPPKLAAVLIHAKSSSDDSLLIKVVNIISCLSVEDLLINPHPDQRDEINERRHSLFPSGKQFGDLIMLQELVAHYRGTISTTMDRRQRREWCKSIGVNPKGMDNVMLVRKQLLSLTMASPDSATDASTTDSVTHEQVLKTFLYGFVGNTALGLPDRRFKTTFHQQTLNIHPSSMIFGTKPAAIMYMEYVFTTKGYARTVSPIEIEWLEEQAPHLLGRARGNLDS